jgi:asparagine synthase (glutamine-hydrolysing)
MTDYAQISRDDVFDFDPAHANLDNGSGPRMLWAAPGSMFLDDVRIAWERRADVRDLADVSGPWAVALWGPRTGYVLAADPVGVQPLFWARTTSGRISAASWLARLVDRPDVDDSYDYEGILLSGHHRLFTDATAHRTNFAAVTRIPWGRAAFFDPPRNGQMVRYWDPRDLPDPDATLSLADCTELVRERVDAAIARLLTDDVPIAAHVSGGLDCTSVACRANDLLRERGSSLRAAYSWSPDEREVPRFEGDERGLLDDVASRLSQPISPVYADESGDWFLSRDVTRYPHSTHNRERFVLPKAAADGVKVMLSGWGGDELISFNGRHIPESLIRQGKLPTVWKLMRDRRRIVTGSDPAFAPFLKSFIGRINRAGPGVLSDIRHPLTSRTMRRHSTSVDAKLREYSPLVADAYRDHAAAFASVRNHHEMQLALFTNGHIQHRTMGWYLTGQLFDIDYRYPLLDKNVVETALGMPWPAFFSHGWDRIAYRMAIEPWVPPSVAWNPMKYEPAHMWPPEKVPVPRPTPEPEQTLPDDPLYREATELIRALRPPGLNRTPTTARVHVRPEMAPTR